MGNQRTPGQDIEFAANQLVEIAIRALSTGVNDPFTAFNQIRQYGRSSSAVTIRLLETIAGVAGFVHRPEDRAALLRHAKMIVRGARAGLLEDEDRQEVEERFQSANQLLNESPDSNL